MRMRLMVLALILAAAARASPEYVDKPWVLRVGAVHTHIRGEDLAVDVFLPTGKGTQPFMKPGDGGKGLGVIDVVSGGWSDSTGRRTDHEIAGLFHILCARGFTIFAVRPGGLPRFTGLEMVENLHRAIRWVKAHAGEYGIDPDRIGLMGASAGGHLSLLTMLSAQPAQPDAEDPLLRYDSSVKAVVAFFPPTDFLDWDGQRARFQRQPHLFFSDGLDNRTQEEADAMAASLSPLRQVREKTPLVFLVHGDKDPVVPLQQSLLMEEALRAVGTDVTLYIKEGGAHFWLTIYQELLRATDWLELQLNQ